MIDKLQEHLGDIGTQAVGHFCLGWGEEDCPAVVAPYKYRICETQHGTAYSEIGELLFGYERTITEYLEESADLDEEDINFLQWIGRECTKLVENIDNSDGGRIPVHFDRIFNEAIEDA